MKVQVYAVLKDYFDKEFEISENVCTIDELKEILIQLNPEVKYILPVCRFAINDIFVSNDFQFQYNDQIHIMPPSSGG